MQVYSIIDPEQRIKQVQTSCVAGGIIDIIFDNILRAGIKFKWICPAQKILSIFTIGAVMKNRGTRRNIIKRNIAADLRIIDDRINKS